MTTDIINLPSNGKDIPSNNNNPPYPNPTSTQSPTDQTQMVGQPDRRTTMPIGAYVGQS